MKKKPKEPTLPTDSSRIPLSKAATNSTVNPSKWIRNDRAFPLPSYVKEALQRLNEAGHIAYIVGGSVRDFLLGKEVKDHDIATSADPNELCKLFPKAIEVGKAFGVIKVPTGTQPPLLEIATFRKDLDYKDYRRPKGVVFTGPLQDAVRRDFTINALFYDPKTSRILDVTGGVEDLKNKILRAIGNPSERFREDALRLLRAIRFKTRLGFELEPSTLEAIVARAKLITKISSERVRDELTLMWMGPQPSEALSLLSEMGLLTLLIPELQAIQGVPQVPSTHKEENLWGHTLKMVQILVEQNPAPNPLQNLVGGPSLSVRTPNLLWAAVLHEVGKPVALRLNHGKNFNGHEQEGAKLAQQITQRFKMSRADCDRISLLVGEHTKFREVFQMRESTFQRFIREPHFPELLALHKADAISSDGNLAYYEFCASRFETFKQSSEPSSIRLVDGKDLIQLGFQPGPEFSEILNVLEDLALEKKLTTKEEALEYVLKTFVR